MYESADEPIGIWSQDSIIAYGSPLEQVSATHDATDYFWYVREDIEVAAGTATLWLEEAQDHVTVYFDNEYVGASLGGKNITFKIQASDNKKNHKLQILT